MVSMCRMKDAGNPYNRGIYVPDKGCAGYFIDVPDEGCRISMQPAVKYAGYGSAPAP